MKNNKNTKNNSPSISETLRQLGQFPIGKRYADVKEVGTSLHVGAKQLGGKIVTRTKNDGSPETKGLAKDHIRVWLASPLAEKSAKVSYPIKAGIAMPTGGRGRPSMALSAGKAKAKGGKAAGKASKAKSQPAKAKAKVNSKAKGAKAHKGAKLSLADKLK